MDEFSEFNKWLESRTVAKNTPSKPVEVKAHTRHLVAKKGTNTGGNLGYKKGKTSQYHYVCWLSAAKKWTASVKIDGKNKNVYRGDSEIDAAEAVDKYLDSIHDDERPRNFS